VLFCVVGLSTSVPLFYKEIDCEHERTIALLDILRDEKAARLDKNLTPSDIRQSHSQADANRWMTYDYLVYLKT
jgi:hypothetical protein